jgi:hypothetical protein
MQASELSDHHLDAAVLQLSPDLHGSRRIGDGTGSRSALQLGVRGQYVTVPSSTWMMRTSAPPTIVRRVYDTVNMVFWALAIGTVVFLFLHIPQMREARTIAEAQRLQDITKENKRYCEKWGMQTGTHEHLICTMDLDAIRAEVEQRIADDSL